MGNRLAPVDLRVADDGTVWHVGDPAAWGKGALDNADPRESMRRLQADEIRFIGPDYVQGSHLNFEAHLVALSDVEREVVELALRTLVAQATDMPATTVATALSVANRVKVESLSQEEKTR